MPSGKAGLTDYSKWDNIELSDDEEDCHPNIEKGTWFRLKHQKRVEREAKEKEERDELAATIEKNTQKIAEIEGDSEEKTQLQNEVDKCHARLAKMDKNQKWNADNMCKTTEDRTIINRETTAHAEGYAIPESTDKDKSFLKSGVLNEETKVQTYQDYVDKFGEMLKKFSELKTMEETCEILKEHGDVLLQEHASWYLLLACLDAEMDGDRKKMKLRARQSQILSSITELAKTEKRHPGNIIHPFFERMKDPRRFGAFMEGVEGFAQRIEERAVAKKKEQELGLAPGGEFTEGMVVEAFGLKGAPELNGLRGEVKAGKLKSGRIPVVFPTPHGEKALKKDNLKVISLEQLKAEEELAEKQQREMENDPNKCWWLPNHLSPEERMGPGGLDPVELFAELPRVLQDAFRSREIEPLHEAIGALGVDEARGWLEKCSKAGLWNPGGDDDDEEEEEEPAAEVEAPKPAPKRPAPAL